MRSFNQTPSGGQLRDENPQEAVGMDYTLMKHNAQKLGIQFKTKTRKGIMVMEFPLTNDHFMRISPVDRGPGGSAEYFSFLKKPTRIDPQRQKVVIEVVETIRVHVEIFHNHDNAQELIFSHTLHEDSLEKVIRGALEGIYQTKNRLLTPIELRPKSKKGLTRDQKKIQPPLDLTESDLENYEDGDNE